MSDRLQSAPVAHVRTVLTIAGSDSGGGAGIQADLKTIAAHGVHGLSAIAALTAQNTRGVTAIHEPPVEFLRAQLEACFDDFRVDVVKIGMLASAPIVREVARALREHSPRFVVLDPVMVAASGAKLIEDEGIEALRHELFPLASLLTPNVHEAELLLGRELHTGEEARAALSELLALGAERVLLKGGHLDEGPRVIDRYADGETREEFESRRVSLEGHGLGCSLASAVAAQLARGLAPRDAVEAGLAYVQRAIEGAYHPGVGPLAVLDHLGNRVR